MEALEKTAVNQHGKYLHNLVWRARKKNPKLWMLVVIVTMFRMVWKVITFQAGEAFISTASNCYAAAGDIRNRRKLRGIFWTPQYLAFGLLSVLFAFAFLAVRFGDVKRCNANELDVVGSILSRAGFWGMIPDVYDEIAERYHRNDGSATPATYALACKWMSGSPLLTPFEHRDLLQEVRDILEKHPEYPPEVRIRLYEALGDTKNVQEMRKLLPE